MPARSSILMMVALWAASARADRVAPPALRVVAVQSEHSRDSSSRTVEITLEAGELVVRQTRDGHRGDRRPPEPVRRKLDEAGLRELRRLVAESGLMKAKDVDAPFEGPGIEYRFEMTARLDGKARTVKLHGPVSEWRGEGKRDAPAFAKSEAYLAAVALVDALQELAKASP